MKRVFSLILVGLVTFGVIYLIKNPQVIEDIWMWLVGLSGSIVAIGQKVISFVKERLNLESISEQVPLIAEKPLSLKLTRYADDGKQSKGILYLDGELLGYTLERSGKLGEKPSNERIPVGTYPVIFNPTPEGSEQKFKDQHADWFNKHLLIEVPDLPQTFIKAVSDQVIKPGEVLLSDSKTPADLGIDLNEEGAKYKEMYKELTRSLELGKKVQIEITDSK